jgi:hypothetical protein
MVTLDTVRDVINKAPDWHRKHLTELINLVNWSDPETLHTNVRAYLTLKQKQLIPEQDTEVLWLRWFLHYGLYLVAMFVPSVFAITLSFFFLDVPVWTRAVVLLVLVMIHNALGTRLLKAEDLEDLFRLGNWRLGLFYLAKLFTLVGGLAVAIVYALETPLPERNFDSTVIVFVLLMYLGDLLPFWYQVHKLVDQPRVRLRRWKNHKLLISNIIKALNLNHSATIAKINTDLPEICQL